MSLFKLGCVKLPHSKNTAAVPAERISAPSAVLIPLSQNIGAASTPTVKVGDRVFVGTKIAEAGGFVGAPIHSSVSGTVKKIQDHLMASGKTCPAILIESDGEMTPDPSISPRSVGSFEELSAAARDAGLVGLGGAGFPTSVKLDPKKIASIDVLLINAAECEPYITSDTRTMIDRRDAIRRGVDLILSFAESITDVIIGIESNKPECISIMKELFADNSKVKVVSLPSRYPQGGEKILIHNTTGRVVPEGGLPSDVGVIVMNVTTLATLAEYIETGMPLVEKCITVDGSAVKNPKNVIAPIGTPISDVLSLAKIETDEIGKIVYGGPMMGVAIYDISSPVLKNTNAVTLFNKKDAKIPKTTACLHCGRCVSACPMGLNPTAFIKAMKLSDKAECAERLSLAKVNLCIECGSCSYVCPAKRPLVETNKLAKAALREHGAKNK